MARRPRAGGIATVAAQAPPPAVAIRMYRQGLGDCFLLRFSRRDGPLFMLIDCGVLLGTAGQNERMREIADDIRVTTDGHIDVLVATHEHWDHLSGFLQAADVFDQITLGELWLAWTEDPHHDLANQLRRGREAALRALTAAHLRLQAVAPEEAEALGGVLEFAGPLGAAGGQTVTAALERLREKVVQPRYCRPGSQPITLPGVDGVRIYVLGPPEDERLIKRSNPTKTGREVYELAASAEVDAALFAALAQAASAQALKGDQLRDYELSLPFDLGHRIATGDAQAHPFFNAVYYGQGEPGPTEDPSWRQIESDWLGAAHDLALRLDNDTNNTSLALAIELSPGGAVLLFPGDAQVGNWLSWAELVWPEEGAGHGVSALDLLARTILYKVGHHASHNATLRDGGLELMSSPELVAMIPVDQERAEQKTWNMPFGPLLRRLEEKCRGRVIRADRPVRALGPQARPDGVSEGEWQAFCERLSPDPEDRLFVEYRIPLAAGAAAA